MHDIGGPVRLCLLSRKLTAQATSTFKRWEWPMFVCRPDAVKGKPDNSSISGPRPEAPWILHVSLSEKTSHRATGHTCHVVLLPPACWLCFGPELPSGVGWVWWRMRRREPLRMLEGGAGLAADKVSDRVLSSIFGAVGVHLHCPRP
jgi:hypothetical protein